jgi:hypothetical protein
VSFEKNRLDVLASRCRSTSRTSMVRDTDSRPCYLTRLARIACRPPATPGRRRRPNHRHQRATIRLYSQIPIWRHPACPCTHPISKPRRTMATGHPRPLRPSATTTDRPTSNSQATGQPSRPGPTAVVRPDPCAACTAVSPLCHSICHSIFSSLTRVSLPPRTDSATRYLFLSCYYFNLGYQISNPRVIIMLALNEAWLLSIGHQPI